MRIVFMGSSKASAYALRAIRKSSFLEVACVVTQPDRPSGRHQRSTPCDCKAYATKHEITPIITPEKVNNPEVLEQIASYKPDVIVVVAFGQFLGKKLLQIPRYGCLNGHFSLLPKYRGAAPVPAAIAAGDEVSGVTIMRMAEGMDDGDMLLKAIEPICSDDTAVTLMERLSILGAVAMVKALRLLGQGELPSEPQDHDKATFAYKMQKSDGLINWNMPAAAIERRIRAYIPWPGAFTFLPERLLKPSWEGRIKVLQGEIIRERPSDWQSYEPGTVCMLTPKGPAIMTQDYPLCLSVLQPDGSRLMDGKTFLNGRPLKIGDRFTDGK